MRIAKRLCDSNWINHVHAYTPQVVRFVAGQVLQYGAAMARRRRPIYRYEGRMAESSKSACVIVADHPGRISYFIQPLFDEPVKGELIEHVSGLRLPGVLDRLSNEADLVIARFHAGLARSRFDDRYLCVPEMVECRSEVPVDGSLPDRAKKGQDGNLRLLRKTKLRWETSHRLEDFKHFYHEMYLPFVEQRFGNFAYERSERYWRIIFLRGGLMWIFDGDRRVAGSLYSMEGDVFLSWIGGMAGGDLNLLKRGVTPAMDVFSFELAHKLGAKYYNMGLSRPSLTDGVLTYKKRWGAVLRTGQVTYCNFYLRWNRYHPVITRLLSQTPLLVHDGEALTGLAAVDRPTEGAGLERVGTDLAMPGLQRLCVLMPRTDQPRRVALQDRRVQNLDMRLMPQVESASLNHLMKQFSKADEATRYKRSPAPETAPAY